MPKVGCLRLLTLGDVEVAMKLVGTLLVLALAIIFSQRYLAPVQQLSKEAKLLTQFNSFLESSPLHSAVHWKDVSVGYNTNTDLVVDAVSVLKALGFAKPPAQSVSPSIEKMDDFTALVAYFMAQGSAVERVIVDTGLCETIVNAAVKAHGTKEAESLRTP